jgi:hypothetical protein
MTRKSYAACAAVSLMALAGCASSPAKLVTGPAIQAPAAWAMTPSNSIQTYNAVFLTTEKPSAKTPEN